MNRWVLAIALTLCGAAAVAVMLDAYRVHRDIKRNHAAIEHMSAECRAAERRIHELEETLSRIRTDRRFIEAAAFKRYRLLRPDQYITHDAPR